MKQPFSEAGVPCLFLVLLLASCTGNQPASQPASRTTTEQQPAPTNDALTQERLRRFDSLDFQFYSNQQWDSFAISHDQNIRVIYPDGSETTGLFPQHINQLTPMFAFAPDTKIIAHPVKFGSGDWTAVIGEMEGTFSRPMNMGNGKVIPPTGKKFRLTMSTIGHWRGGRMIEEYLHWDNQSLMKQIGLAQ
ncbi:ester cyclase [Flaviaesturariibacter aridisoli]|uniref:Polyketide cyclase n=1 Tax=Flaviaesturariibacter aridisoli TaxID=2545761 RepID=A0A4V2WMU2_9BACT|nr:ester cyclase [Flaviaesturariibacter aridisoli]TCZ72952.1 polyketide cyclase [Flaviaesturariibacter aridisoli]